MSAPEALAQQGGIVIHGDPAKLAAVMQAERRWDRRIQAANVTLGRAATQDDA